MEKKWSWLILLLPLIPWFDWFYKFFFIPKYSEFSDLTITHLPNAIYLLHSIKTYGEIPFWSDLIFSGYPFAANPLSGLWYPPGWVAYGFPLPFGFNLAVFIHLLWGAIGIQRFLNFQGLRQEASFIRSDWVFINAETVCPLRGRPYNSNLCNFLDTMAFI